MPCGGSMGGRGTTSGQGSIPCWISSFSYLEQVPARFPWVPKVEEDPGLQLE